MMLPDVLTVDQLAQLLDCTAETIEERTRARDLPGVKYGRSWVYPRDAVLEVLRRQALAHVRPVADGGDSGAPTLAAARPAGAALRVVTKQAAPRPSRRNPAPLTDPPAVRV